MVDLQSVQHVVEILLAVRDFLHGAVKEFESTVAPHERNGFFNGNRFPVQIWLVGVTALVENGDANFGAGRHTTRGRVAANEIFHVAGPVRAAGVGPEANLNGGQHGGFATAVLSMYKIDVAIQLDAEFAVAHEIFAVARHDSGWSGNESTVGECVIYTVTTTRV